MKRMLTAVCLVMIIFIFTGQGYSQNFLDGIAADINGEIILMSDIDLIARSIASERNIDPREKPEEFLELKKLSLARQIEKKVLLAKAVEDSVFVTDEEVNNALEGRIQEYIRKYGSESELERLFGMNIKTIKKFYFGQLKEDLTIQSLQQKINREVKINRIEVEEFFNTFKDSLPEIPDQYHLAHIVMKVKPNETQARLARSKIDSLKRLLDSGTDFQELAKASSEDPGSAPNGGNLGFFNLGDLDQAFEKAALELESGEISNVVQTSFGFHIIQLIERQSKRFNSRHILVMSQTTPTDDDSTIAKLLEVRQSALNGEDFASLALQYSDDPTVAQNKGDLGSWTVQNMRIPEYTQEMAKLQEGEFSQPFKSQYLNPYGFGILYLKKKVARHSLTIQDDWVMIENMARGNKQNKAFSDYLQKAKNEVYIDIKIKDYK